MTPTHPADSWALILAGGDGTRLQSLTRAITGRPIPKQYCRIDGERSLLERTLDRLRGVVPLRRTLAVVADAHRELALSQLGHLPRANLFSQPRNLDTGPGLVLSLLALERRAPDATLLVLPSDHFVLDAALFRAQLGRMRRAVEADPSRIVLLGMPPDRPDSGLGYVVPGAPLARRDGARSALSVLRFEEKPDLARAFELAARGALWNSFVMALRVGPALASLRRARPRDVALLGEAASDPARVARAYAALEPWSFSRDFLARVPGELAVLRSDDFGWSDWGTPETILRTAASHGLTLPWQPLPERRAVAG